MKQKAERVPVRWGFVVPAGIVVAAVVGGAVYFGVSAAAKDPQYRKNAIETVKRIFD